MFRYLVLTLALGASLFAQNFATITGSVSDSSNAAVGAAKITAQNLDTLITKEVMAGDDGLFTVPFLQPGRYKLSAQKAGFRQSVQDSLTLEVNQSARVDFKLEVGQVSETVEVKGGARLCSKSTMPPSAR